MDMDNRVEIDCGSRGGRKGRKLHLNNNKKSLIKEIRTKKTKIRHKYCKHICTQCKSTQIYKENLGGLQESDRWQHTYTRGFNTSLSKMDRSSKQNGTALNNALDQMIKWTYGLKDIYILSSKRSKIHILFKCTWTIFKDRPHDRTQNKPQQIQES